MNLGKPVELHNGAEKAHFALESRMSVLSNMEYRISPGLYLGYDLGTFVSFVLIAVHGESLASNHPDGRGHYPLICEPKVSVQVEASDIYHLHGFILTRLDLQI
jgi:hypothetical protein